MTIEMDLGALLGGIIAGVCAIYAALTAVNRGFAKLEEQEIKRTRVQCVLDLLAFRHVFNPDQKPTAEHCFKFMIEVNKLPGLFADDAEVMNHYRAYLNNRDDPNLHTLLRSLLQKVHITHGSLSNDDLTAIFTLVPKD
jgi:hypothetical protein